MDADILQTTRKSKRSAPEDEPLRAGYATLFWLFMFGSVAGFVLEGLWCVLTDGRWESHTATVWGPFCIIYGIGAVAVYLLSGLLKGRSLPVQFAAFTLSSAAVEFFGSLFQELCFGSVSWDYSAHLLNLGGRVSIKMALMWGALGVVFIRLAFPLVKRALRHLQGRGSRLLCAAMTVFMALNLAVTCAALTRWHERGDTPSDSAVIRWIDSTYDDETMSELFPNMVFTDWP